ncbi:hypothetical protein HYT51_03205 [Candidatus Woesearchaeota archaeon]|nr:hypothetical protein [Candidatus Woesearchaeota archaeon]
MVDFLLKEDLKILLKKIGITNFDELFRKAHSISLMTGFNIPNQFILDLSCPDRMVSYRDNLGDLHILYDPLSLLDDPLGMNNILVQNSAHEICHLAISKTDFYEFYNYRLFKGRFVKELSYQDFKNKINNLMENVLVDTRLCSCKSSMYEGFSKSHGGIDFAQDIEFLQITKKLRKRGLPFPINYTTFNII